jgi:5-methylcytosine-specific restriction endonuclease McrA
MKHTIKEVDPVRGSPDSKVKICVRCSIEFTRKYGEGLKGWAKRRFCSLKCYGRVPNPDLPTKKACEYCGREFDRERGKWSDKQWVNLQFCSLRCAQATFSTVRNRQWNSPEYRKMMSEAHKPGVPNGRAGIPLPNLRGPRSGHWKGGITPVNHRLRTSLEYKLWRRAVFQRDNYTCVWCGVRGGKGVKVELHADHIKAFAFYPDLRFEVSNGRTLCKGCHRKTDTFSAREKK